MVNSNIARVWQFYTDMHHLEVITPPNIRIRIVKSSHEQLIKGSDVWLAGRLIMIEIKWHSKITLLRPYQYIDEMSGGIFKTWRHAHTFRKIDEETTEVIDEIEFELPYGPIGRIFEGYAYNRLEKIFEHRKQATIKALSR